MKQQGFSLLLFIGVVFLVSFLGLIGFKVTPVYLEYFTVRQNVQSLADEHYTSMVTIPIEAKKILDKKFHIDNVTSVSARDAKIDRVGGGYRVRLKYDVPVELSDHVTISLHFNQSVVVNGNAR